MTQEEQLKIFQDAMNNKTPLYYFRGDMLGAYLDAAKRSSPPRIADVFYMVYVCEVQLTFNPGNAGSARVKVIHHSVVKNAKGQVDLALLGQDRGFIVDPNYLFVSVEAVTDWLKGKIDKLCSELLGNK